MNKIFLTGFTLMLSACAVLEQKSAPPRTSERPPVKVVPAPAQPKPLVDDATIATRLRAALLAEPAMRGSNIAISVEDGKVELRGTVPNDTALRKATAVAGKISGVRTVRNQLKIK